MQEVQAAGNPGAGRQRREIFLALLFYVCLTALTLAPLLYSPHKLPSGEDTYEYVWKLWWFKHTLLDNLQSPWIAPHIYYPHGYLLAYGETTPLNTVLGLPLTLVLGEVSTYNVLVLFSTFVAGSGMFLLAYQATGNVWAGLLAGIIFAFAPYRRAQMAHLNVLSVQWFPFIFYFLERFVRRPRPLAAVLSGLAFGLNALASWYQAVAAAVLLLSWIVFRARPWRTYVADRQVWIGLSLFALVTTLLVVPFAIPYLPVVGDPDTAIPMENSNYFGASFTDYFIPNVYHPLWGDWVLTNLTANQDITGEFLVGWGFVAWLFALYGVSKAKGAGVRPWLSLTLVAVVLSLGLTLHLAGRQVVIPTPPKITSAVNQFFSTVSSQISLTREPFSIARADGIVVPLPALLLRWFVPVLGQVRTWVRFGQFAILGVAMLAAFGVDAWFRGELAGNYSPTKMRIAGLLLISVALFELWKTPVAMSAPILRRPVDDWLVAQPGQFAIMEYPLTSSLRPEQFIYSRAHGKPIAFGYGTYFTFLWSRRHQELLDFPSHASLRTLADWNVRYVLLETGGFGQEDALSLLPAVAAEPCLHFVTQQASVQVYELGNCAALDGH